MKRRSSKKEETFRKSGWKLEVLVGTDRSRGEVVNVKRVGKKNSVERDILSLMLGHHAKTRPRLLTTKRGGGEGVRVAEGGLSV